VRCRFGPQIELAVRDVECRREAAEHLHADGRKRDCRTPRIAERERSEVDGVEAAGDGLVVAAEAVAERRLAHDAGVLRGLVADGVARAGVDAHAPLDAVSAATEEVINRVGSADPSRLKVIDRLTAAKFKRTNECIIHIGRALGADFVMEGSLLDGRTTAALYRVADNTQVWAAAVEPRARAAAISAKIASTFLR
jgi:hypothetical protein